MFHIFTRLSRVPSQPKQCLQQISRSYCYKPVERRIAASSDLVFNRMLRRRKKPNNSIFNSNAEQLKREQEGGRSLEIIQALPSDPKHFTETQLIEAYDQLSVGPISYPALLHENFDTFIDATEAILPKLSVSQNVHIFKRIEQAQISMFDELTGVIVKALLQRINLITVDEIIDVDFVLRRFYERTNGITKLLERLRQGMRVIFVVKVNDELAKEQSTKNLVRILQYLSNNHSLVQSVDTLRLSEQLLLKDDDEFRHKDIVCTIASLARFPPLDEHSKQLMTKMYRMWYGNTQPDIESVKDFLTELLDGSLNLKKSELPNFHEPFFVKSCTQITIKNNNMRSAFEVLNLFNHLNCKSTELIEFLSNVFNTDKHKKLKIDDYVTFCTACERANYKPTNWDKKVVPAIIGANIQKTNFSHQVDLALTLHKLGIRHDRFIEHIFSSAQLQNWHKNDSRLAELQKAYSIKVPEPRIKRDITPYISWLTSDLENFIGADKVLNNVYINHEFTIPIVLKVNTLTGDFADMTESNEAESLICNKNELIVGVITQDIGEMKDNFDAFAEQLNMKRKLIKERGWIGITLTENLYGTMETYKRAYTFFKILQYAINNRNSRQ